MRKNEAVRSPMRWRSQRNEMPTVSGGGLSQARERCVRFAEGTEIDTGRRRHVHDLLCRSVIMRAGYPIGLRPCVPLSLLSHGARETVDWAAHQFWLFAVPHLQDRHCAHTARRPARSHQRAQGRCQEESNHAVRDQLRIRFVNSALIFGQFFSLVHFQFGIRRRAEIDRQSQGHGCLCHRSLCVLCVLQMHESVLWRRG